MKTLAKLSVMALVAVGFMANTAAAQQRAVGQQQLQQQGGQAQAAVQVAPAISPSPSPTPRLGFMGQMLHGYGMRVLNVNWGSAASNAGLERGDVIMSINGRRILSQFDYDQALRNAAWYRGGMVNLMVRNIRFDYGQSFQEYVNVTTYLPGYGGGFPVAGAVGPRSVQGGVVQGQMVQGSQRQAVQGGGVQRRAAQGGGVQGRSAAQGRSQVREITRSQVPAMKSTDTGSGF